MSSSAEGDLAPGLARAIYVVVAAPVQFLLRWVLRWRFDIRGLDNVPPDRGAIVAFNHNSYTDFFVTALPLYYRLGRRPKFLAKKELLRTPVLGWLIRRSGQIPVDRGARDGRAEALGAAVEALRRGELVTMAPEQTISQSFELLPFRTGAARIAQAAEAVIVPSVNFGSQRFLTKGQPRRLALRIPVTVRYGDPIEVAEDDDPVEVTKRLQDTMAAMLDEVVRTYPDRDAGQGAAWFPRRHGGAAPDHDEVLSAHLEREATWRDDERDDHDGNPGQHAS